MTTNERFAIIQELMEENHPYLNVKWLCDLAQVSRSGYYNWVNSADKRAEREQQDAADFALIRKAYEERGYAKGARGIYMRMLHWDPPVVMNIKKIRRLMKKFDLKCPIRKANPYRRMAKALATDRKCKNLLDRRFEELGARKVLLTDITYIQYNGRTCYLSTILDAYTKQILSWKMSESLEIPFVLETLEDAMKNHGVELESKAIIHSDQGVHYTSVKFGDLVRDSRLLQSMSRRGNCWDNAPQESFYGHMKDEIDLSSCTTFEDAVSIISDFMDYYNNERYQWDLELLSPNEFYEYTKTGIHPLGSVLKKYSQTREDENPEQTTDMKSMPLPATTK